MDRFRLGKVAPFLRAMDGEKAIVSTDAKTNGLPPHFERSQSESSALDRILCSLRFLRWVVSCFTAPAARQTSPSPRYRILRPYRFPAVFGLPLNELFFASLAHAGTLGTSGLHGAGDRSAPRQARPPQSFREFRMQPDFRSSSPPAGRMTGRWIQGCVPHSAALPAIDGSAVLLHYQP